jgi:hypothetical protein
VNAIAPSAPPDEAETPAQQIHTLTDLVDNAMCMVRLAVEQYEALVHAPADAAPSRRQADPGSLFVRFARIVLNGIANQSRLAAGLPIGRFAPPPTVGPKAQPTGGQKTPPTGGPKAPPPAGPYQAAEPTPADPTPAPEASLAEPLLQALRTATRNHPRGPKLFRAGVDCLAAALAADPRGTADLPSLFRRVCDQAGIHLNPSEWRRAARNLTPNIRAAPA